MQYAVPVLLLILTILVFFAMARGGFAAFGMPQILLRVLVALPLLVSGIFVHFFRINTAAGIIPPVFPAREFLVVLTGVFEIAGAIGLFVPRFRRAAAFWIAVTMVAFIPVNVYAAGKGVDGLRMPGVAVRTSAQIVYIVLVLLSGYGVPRPSSSQRMMK